MPSESKRPVPPDPPAETAAQALERAGTHARRAWGEALAAARAILDAASLGWSGRPSDAHSSLRGLAELLDEQSARFATGEGAVPASVMNAILEALDQEIERWERQAGEDPDARAVLRTFLGLREILWEFGLRRDSPSRGSGSTSRPRSKPARKNPGELEDKARPPRRVQRVDVQG